MHKACISVGEFLKNRPTFLGQISVPFFGTVFRPFKNSDKNSLFKWGDQSFFENSKSVTKTRPLLFVTIFRPTNMSSFFVPFFKNKFLLTPGPFKMEHETTSWFTNI